MTDKNLENTTEELDKKIDDIHDAKDKSEAAAKAEINFVYTITNDGSKISKKFDGKASPQDVVMTLLSCIIADVKTNLEESAYADFLDIIGTEYAKQLLPHLLEEKALTAKEEAKDK